MALTKVTYVDDQTVIEAAQLNAIQDEIIRVAEEVDATPSHLESTPEKIPVFGATGKVYWRSPEELKADMHADYTVNVKDFGAKGDGSTDDTAAIQAAIDYAVALQAALRLLPGRDIHCHQPPARPG